MSPTKAVELTSKNLHSALIHQLLGFLEITKDVKEPKRSEEIAQMAFLISKEVYDQAREALQPQRTDKGPSL
jgi:hypothetical protein